MNWHDQISPGGWLWFLIPTLSYLIYKAKPLIKSQQSQIKGGKETTVKVQRESTTKNLELQVKTIPRKKKNE